MNACGLCVGVKHREVPNSHKSLYVQIRVAIRPAMVPSSVTTFWAGIDKDHPNRPRTRPTRVYALARISLSRIAGTKRSPDAGSQYASKASSSTAVSTSHGNSAGSPGMGTGGMIRSRSRAPSRTTSTGSCSPPSFRTIAPRTRPPSTENTNVTWCGVGSAARACPALLSRHVPEIVWMSRSTRRPQPRQEPRAHRRGTAGGCCRGTSACASSAPLPPPRRGGRATSDSREPARRPTQPIQADSANGRATRPTVGLPMASDVRRYVTYCKNSHLHSQASRVPPVASRHRNRIAGDGPTRPWTV